MAADFTAPGGTTQGASTGTGNRQPLAGRAAPQAGHGYTTNLADARLGARAVACSDEFFAPMSRMLQSHDAVFLPDKYDDHGKWMDGWESRRRRRGGHDFCVVRLATPGEVLSVDIDTSHFTGNFPPAASLEGCRCKGDPDAATEWTTLVAPAPIGPDSHHRFDVAGAGVVTHVRLNLLPDGGVARLRVFGRPHPDWGALAERGAVDLGCARNGAVAVAWNNSHYGHPSNILRPDRARDAGEGWETRRRREPGHDWCIVALARPGIIDRVVVDTSHYKGNFPDRCSLQGALLAEHFGALQESVIAQSMFWPLLLPEQPLQADREHTFVIPADAPQPVSHVHLNIIPDGGVARLRLFGTPVEE
ncbi:MAG: allantoicase [Spirochaetaceae bacterium]|nr:allantoicase [Spirochaetaceae bacterium]